MFYFKKEPGVKRKEQRNLCGDIMNYAENFDKDRLSELRKALSSPEYANILKPSTKKDNIIIENETISRLSNGKVAASRNLDIKALINKAKSVALPQMGSKSFWSPAVKINPLEADRDRGEVRIWKNEFRKVNFPFAMPVALAILLETGTIPTLVDLVKIYIGLYMEPVPEGKEVQHRPTYFCNPEKWVDKDGNMIDRKTVGESIEYIDGSTLKNHLLRFRREFMDQCYVKTKLGNSRLLSFPYNEFTAEMIANRLKKAYASLIRDILFGLQCHLHEEAAGRKNRVVYNLYFDIKYGVDLIFNETYVLGSTSTKGADLFNKIKAEEEECRHENLKDVKYAVRTKAEVSDKDGIYIIEDEELHQFCENVASNVYVREENIPFFVYGNKKEVA